MPFLALMQAGVLALSTTAVGGSSPTTTNGVALHIVAHGEAVMPADRITVGVTVNGKGATDADARADADRAAERLRAALVANGVAATSIAINNDGVDPLVMASAIEASVADATLLADGVRGAPMRRAATGMTVIVADRAGLDILRRNVRAAGASLSMPVASLQNDAGAKSSAAAMAIANAQAEAQRYASALGMRIMRITAVSNTAGFSDGLQGIVGSIEDRSRNMRADVVTVRAVATIDFALAPR